MKVEVRILVKEFETSDENIYAPKTQGEPLRIIDTKPVLYIPFLIATLNVRQVVKVYMPTTKANIIEAVTARVQKMSSRLKKNSSVRNAIGKIFSFEIDIGS